MSSSVLVLGDEFFPIQGARTMLAGQDIPFGFAGGGSLLSTIPERHLHRPTVHKPYGINHLEQFLRGLGCVRRLRTPA